MHKVKVADFLKLDFRGYIIIFSCVLLEIAITFLTTDVNLKHQDFDSYWNASYVLADGGIDLFRTPVYPLFLEVCRVLCGELNNVLVMVCCLQWIVFAISCVYLGKILDKVSLSRKLSFFIVMFYALCPGINSCNFQSGTESFAISFTVFFCWWMLKAIEERTVISHIVVGVLVFVMIMLRPAFLYVLPVIILVEIVAWYKSKRNLRLIILDLGISICVILGVFAYINQVNNTYGIKTISNVTDINNYFLVRDIKALPGDDFQNKELLNTVDSLYKNPCSGALAPYHEADLIIDRYGVVEYSKFINSCIKANLPVMIGKVGGRLFQASSMPVFWCMIPSLPTSIWNLFAPNLSLFYVIAVIWLLITLMQIFKGKLNIENFFLILLYVSGLVMGVVGAPAEWGRLTLPCVVPMLFFIGWVCSRFKFQNNKL